MISRIKTKHQISTHFDADAQFAYPNRVWRSDHRPPETVKKSGGFYPRGSNDSLEGHVLGFGGYVSTSKNAFDSMRFVKIIPQYQIGNYLYQLSLPKIFVDIIHSPVLKRLSTQAHGMTFAEKENEVAAINFEWKDVKQARRFIAMPSIGAPYCFIGPVIQNEFYKPHNFSVIVPSLNNREAEEFEQDNRQSKLLATDERLIKVDEAKEIVAELEGISQHYFIDDNSKHFKISKVPQECTSRTKLINYAVDQYNHFNKEAGISPKQKTIVFANKSNVLFSAIDAANAPEPTVKTKSNNTQRKL